jgi:acyl carrier protein
VPGRELDLRIQFRTDVFDAASIEALIERLQRVVVAMTADPTQRLSSTDLLDAGEHTRLTANGKLDKPALPAPEYSDAEGYRAPADAVEEIVAGIYAQVLGLERVGVDESFFDLGGDSLSAMRVIAAINTVLDVRLAMPTLFHAPSVRSLSQQLGRHASTDSFVSVHRRDTTKVHAGDLALDGSLDAAT